MIAYLSQNADKRIYDVLIQEGFTTIPLAPFEVLSSPVDTHADMLLLDVEKTLFVHKDYNFQNYKYNKIIKIDEDVSDKYPFDIPLNIAIVGKNVFCNIKFASKTIIEYLKSNEFIIHHVAQGYAHCSTCIVSDNALITSDSGIANAAKASGLDVLEISEGYISLPPYNHGFIGGCCGSYKDKIYFCGSLNYHPDGNRIRQFCKAHGKTTVDIYNSPLVDIGGILFN